MRQGNVGGIGNTLEYLLGIEENNLPIPNASEWELKCQRYSTRSLLTLFHMEPSPRALKFVPQILLPKYGWRHNKAGKLYGEEEMSFRQTISGLAPTDRGFCVRVDRENQKVVLSFDANAVHSRHTAWLNIVADRVGLGEIIPQPYWGFDDLRYKAGTKLTNCFFVQAEVKREGGKEFFHYSRIAVLQGFCFEAFLTAIEVGDVLIDIDARTGHNHGTKFRLRPSRLSALYQSAIEI